MDPNDKCLELRLEAIRTAQDRSRYALLAATPYKAMREKGALGLRDLTMVFFWDFVAIVLIVPAAVLCYRIFRFANATEHLLREFWQSMIADFGHDVGVNRNESAD